MPRTLLIAIAAIGAVYLAFCAYLFIVQRSLIYFPQPRTLHNARAIALPTPAGDVLVTVRPHNGRNALIYFGGNAEDTSLNLPEFSNVFPDSAIYLMNYRGYGGSAGKPTEAALIADGLALFDKAYADHKDVTIIGRSLGAAVAIQIASQRPASRLILVTPFHSLLEFAALQFRFFPAKLLLKDHYDSWRYAPAISMPTTIIAAEHDEIIPRESTELLYKSFKDGIATMKVAPGVGHNTIQSNPVYFTLMKEAK
jgi:pimeloyl-ACP methyl ester carboxylesterase